MALKTERKHYIPKCGKDVKDSFGRMLGTCTKLPGHDDQGDRCSHIWRPSPYLERSKP